MTLGTIYSSSLFPGRCPPGNMLVLCYIGGAKNRAILDQTHEKIVEQVRAITWRGVWSCWRMFVSVCARRRCLCLEAYLCMWQRSGAVVVHLLVWACRYRCVCWCGPAPAFLLVWASLCRCVQCMWGTLASVVQGEGAGA